jgi:hypothetical protein
MTETLAARLRATWRAQAESGFLLADPGATGETRRAFDAGTGLTFCFRWLPHREIRFDTAELARRGVLESGIEPAALFRDPRDPEGRYCFLCPENLRIAFPAQLLIPVHAGGRDWFAGVNFAWLADHHFTVMTADHIDQTYDRAALEAMVELHRATDGEFRVVYNGEGAGTSIPWHRHLHITTEALPIEALAPGAESDYPLPLHRFPVATTGIERVHETVRSWIGADPEHHRVNLLIAGPPEAPTAFVLERDVRRPAAAGKGPMGGFEAAGFFPYSDPLSREGFERADLETAQRRPTEIRPPAYD